MKTLVFMEQRDGKLKKNAFEALSLGRKLAGTPSNLAAVIVGDKLNTLVDELKGYGVDHVYTGDSPELEKYNVINYAAAIEAAIREFDSALIIGVASPMGRDLFPRLSARFNGGIVTDAITCELEEESIVATKPMYAGKCLAEVVLKNNAKQFLTIRPNVFSATKSDDGNTTAQPLNVSMEKSTRFVTSEIRKGQSEKPDLTEAAIIISGGRAMKSAENFSLLEECADVLGATVGASRAAVDAGFAPHSAQVGQTGKTVTPNLYIACGISGAIQHLAGMRTSKVIVAINSDPEAPIFTIADYGIVADLFEAVPILTEKFKTMV